MVVVFESILPIFALVMLGFMLRKGNFVPAEHWKVVEELCFWLFFPAILAETLIISDLSSIELGSYTYTLLMTVASTAAFSLLLWPILHRFWGTRKAQFSTIFQTTTRWHGFIALAIVLKLYGTNGAALVAVAFAVLVPTIQIGNILMLAVFSEDAKVDINQVVKTIFKNPIIWGVLIGLSINLLHIQMWTPVMTMLDLLGRAALGSSLLALGAGLSLNAAINPRKELLVGLFGKLLLTPLIMASWALYFEVTGLAFLVLMVCASVPTAMNGYLLAKKMGGDAQMYAATSTLQTALSFFSIPLILWLSETYLSRQ